MQMASFDLLALEVVTSDYVLISRLLIFESSSAQSQNEVN